MNEIETSKNEEGKISLVSFEIYDELVEHCQCNVKYFERDNTTMAGKQFFDAFRSILQHIEIIRQNVMEICRFSHEYDFDEMTPANGYRSFVKVIYEYIKHTVKVSEYIAENRGNLLFRRQAYVK